MSTIHYDAGEDIPAVLLALIDKGKRANLFKADRNAMREILGAISSDYRAITLERAVSRQ